jgi:hypothetical protein
VNGEDVWLMTFSMTNSLGLSDALSALSRHAREYKIFTVLKKTSLEPIPKRNRSKLAFSPTGQICGRYLEPLSRVRLDLALLRGVPLFVLPAFPRCVRHASSRGQISAFGDGDNSAEQVVHLLEWR